MSQLLALLLSLELRDPPSPGLSQQSHRQHGLQQDDAATHGDMEPVFVPKQRLPERSVNWQHD
jgi:hypothetical protein